MLSEHGEIIDISPRISSRLSVFPGDVPPTREVSFDMKRGDVFTLSALRTTVHLGSHADAPSHYGLDGRTMELQPLYLYWGPCEVVRVRADRLGVITRFGLADLDVAEKWVPSVARLLIATGSNANPDVWSADFLGLEPAFVDWLADAGVKLVGVDTPSVDTADSKDLPSHARFFARDVAIIEGLVLKGVDAGSYELSALPLKLEGFDGSPIRAALRRV
ncbi:MAG: cyclase family protein [Planctomycetota bacterium]|nr:cyclase family protein [Planctomycetota bacterium]MDA1261378.1 cyclase family protein [Planctomycetota bacterium]